MPKVLSVRKLIYLSVCLAITGCYTNKTVINNTTPSSSYEMKKFKSFGNWITIHTFDKGSPYGEISPVIIINNLYFTKVNSFNIGKGKHNVEIASISKIPIKIKDLVVKEGNSIVINAYLKDDPTPISD
ncbi:hypothetical protein ACQY1Q_03090 [Tenacibaculum sp. TC6]|uniref:hypothetical protein n=1 Tax=Tenacibaculum sp. TC6 TaxID=3423223 RepID=UPI003D366571